MSSYFQRHTGSDPEERDEEEGLLALHRDRLLHEEVAARAAPVGGGLRLQDRQRVPHQGGQQFQVIHTGLCEKVPPTFS